MSDTSGDKECPAKRVVTSDNCLASVNPRLAAEWHPTKNGEKTPYSVTAYSHKKVWWVCQYGHEWEAAISSRSHGNGCPYCSGNKTTAENCLAAKNPELAKEWHPTKNDDLMPYDVTPGSQVKAWWICKEGHEWKAAISSRSYGTGCPYCSGQKVSQDNCLATKNPDLAKEWHPTKNGDLTPYDITPGSGVKAWWMCDKGHEWEATINSRSGGRDCPYCSGQKVSQENCLATNYPDLAREWHPTKNGTITPYDVTVKSPQKIWWMCEKGHEWKARVYNRTRGTGCPYCVVHGTSFPEQALLYYLRQIFRTAENRYRIEDVEVDVFIPEINLAVEYDGGFYHNEKQGKDEIKNAFLNEKGIKLIRIREKGLPKINDYGSSIYEYSPDESFKKVLVYLLDFIKSNYHEVLSCSELDIIEKLYLVDFEEDMLTIEECISGYKRKNSLEEKNPEVAKEWHPSKNGKITPSDVFFGSHKKAWWLCKNGHEWQAEVKSRYTGVGCPYCSNKLVSMDNCLATKNPELVKEWHQSKNGNLTPYDVTPGSEVKAWWKCKYGHEWKSIVYTRNNGVGCPYCSGNKVSQDNCFATKNPDLAKEWHPTKNGEKTPYNVTRSSNQKVWWLCKEGHEWEDAINHRSAGRGCPYCSGRRAALDNCLATKNPELAKEWHPTKNGDLTPYDITPGSGVKAWWMCDKGHEWEATVIDRNRGSGCPYCSCLATKNPELAKEWHPTKNDDLTPYDVTPGSQVKAWWICKEGHEWDAAISSRSYGAGCPYCSGNKVSQDNCFATKNPDLAKEWHPTKNGEKTPYNVTRSSNQKVWWLCKEGHEWEARVSNRSNGSGCPYCSNKLVSKDNCLATKNPELAKEWHPTKNGDLTPYDITPGSEVKAWWQCKYGHEWAAVVYSRNNGVGCPYCSRRRFKLENC